MSNSFNLVEKPWVTCSGLDNRVYEFSLRRTFAEANRLRGVAGSSPLETAALHRLLLAILHSALRGPQTASDWKDLWKAGSWDQPWLHDYLDRWSFRFDLFDDAAPFYQNAVEGSRPKSVINLAMDMASGNNAVLFDHHTEDDGIALQPSEAARIVVTAQTFGLAGLCEPQRKLVFTDAPWSRGAIFLLEGDNLFETLALNLLRYDVENSRPFPATSDDRPAWEMDDPFYPARDMPCGYLDYLTWQNRRIFLLVENGGNEPSINRIIVTPGLRLNDAKIREGVYPDPMKHYRVDEKRGYLPLRFNEERALWRDCPALLQVKSPSHSRPPLSIRQLADFVLSGVLPPGSLFRYMVLGMANDQAKIEFFMEAHFPLPSGYLEKDDLVELLSDALKSSEETFVRLRRAASWVAVIVISPTSAEKKWGEIDRLSKNQADQLCRHWAIEGFYWSALERPFFELLISLPEMTSSAMTTWIERLKNTSWTALEQAISLAGDAPKALKAAVRARAELGAGLKELFPETELKEEFA